MSAVWVVTADNHDYDYNEQWFVGAYSTEALAKEAAQGAREKYWKQHSGAKRLGQPNVEIICAQIDVTYGS